MYFRRFYQTLCFPWVIYFSNSDIIGWYTPEIRKRCCISCRQVNTSHATMFLSGHFRSQLVPMTDMQRRRFVDLDVKVFQLRLLQLSCQNPRWVSEKAQSLKARRGRKGSMMIADSLGSKPQSMVASTSFKF